MDPYIERPEIWPDFHNQLIAAVKAILQPLLRPRYAAISEDRLFVVESDRPIRPDVFELWREEMRQPLIQIIEPAAGGQVVTAIEVLSPDNKTAGPRRVPVPQDVWQITLARIRQGLGFADLGQFVACLVTTALNTTLKRLRSDVQTKKRSLSREEPISRRGGELLTDPDSDPSEAAASKEEWAHLLATLSDRDRAIVAGLRGGDQMEELAGRLNISAKTLRRVVERAQQGVLD